jgi:DNA-binding XRE family transcriptional regulator
MAGKRRQFARVRKAAGYTQESLAERLGVDRSTVGRWEIGEVEPQAGQRPKIAEALGISLDQLAGLLAATDAGEVAAARGKMPAGVTVDGLGIPRLLAGPAPRDFDHLPHEPHEQAATVDAVERRTFGKAIVAITLAVPLADTEPGQPVDGSPASSCRWTAPRSNRRSRPRCSP